MSTMYALRWSMSFEVCVAYVSHHVKQIVILQEIYNLIVFYSQNIEFIRLDFTYDDKTKKVA